MKKIFRISLLVTVLTAVLFHAATPGLAQDTTPPTPTELPPFPSLESGFIPFSALGEKDILMRGPYSGEDIRFTLPSSWKPEVGTSLNLLITASFAELETRGERSPGASLEVTLNGNTITTLFLSEVGQQLINIPIPLFALVTERSDGRHVLEFSLDAASDCEYPQKTTIIIHTTSWFDLPHSLIPAKADLTILPRPFYQEDSFLPENALLVIPNNPTSNELQAALTISAAFGRMSSGNLNLALTRVEELTQELRGNSHLIFIGSSNELSGLLRQVSFPNASSLPGDGILQTAVSPWNSSRVVLQVSGSDEEGTLKAAQALTFGIIQPGNNVQTAVISNVNPAVSDQIVSDIRTFSSLGYPSRTVNGFGLSTLEYRFYLPPGYVSGNDPHLNLYYSHSALLAFGDSGMVVSLNDQPIGSFQFTEETGSQLNSVKIPLYSDFLGTGDNRLILQVNLQPVNVCSTFVNHGAWFTASSASVLNIPLIPAIPGDITALANLSQYPLPFISTPTLNDVVFILSKDDSHSWRVASSLASQLGRRATGQLLTPQMAFSDELTNDFLNNHLIVIGIPANLPLISQMADAMPAPFEPGSNIVTERTLTVEYRLPTDTSLGYIELFTSPWNIERLVLTILGSTSEGLEWAHNAMTVSSLRGRVTGNFVVVNRTQILSTDARISNTTIVPGASPVLPATQPEASPSVPDTTSTGRPGWLFPSIIILSLLTAVTVVLVVINSLRQRKN